MAKKLPKQYRKFREQFPEIFEAYEHLGETCAKNASLDAPTRRLVKLGMALASGSEGAVHSHVRRAVEEGIDPRKIREVALLGITTIGFPKSMAAMSWIDDLLD